MSLDLAFGLLGSADTSPDAVNWANFAGTSPQVNADQTISGIDTTITLVATLSAGTYGAGAKTFSIYVDGVAIQTLTSGFMTDGATVSAPVVTSNVVHFGATKGAAGSGSNWNATVTVTVQETGAVLDTFTASCDAPP